MIGRSPGKISGAWLACYLSASDKGTRNWLGIAMLPQAGVPLGMALVAANQFPQYQQMLLSIVISSIVLFEIAGPVFTRMAVQHNHS